MVVIGYLGDYWWDKKLPGLDRPLSVETEISFGAVPLCIHISIMLFHEEEEGNVLIYYVPIGILMLTLFDAYLMKECEWWG